MLDFRHVGADLEGFRAKLTRRPSFDARILDEVAKLFAQRTEAIHKTQALQEQRNQHSKAMGAIMKSGSAEEKDRAREQGKTLSEDVKRFEQDTKDLEIGSSG